VRRSSAIQASFLFVSLFLMGCTPADSPRTYLTWAVTGEPLPPARIPLAEDTLPVGARPWAGTVSHHLLTDALIDRWFEALAKVRSVKVFYVLSPSHWGLSVQQVSLTDGRWAVQGGWVESDQARVVRLAQRLRVPLEPRVFDPEHGVSTLMPYLAKYFPNARVVAVAYRGEPPVDQPLVARIAAALEPEFDASGRNENFLLLSTDFAHHGDLEGTKFKDNRSRLFFERPGPDRWILVGCDNRPGIYTLSRFLAPGDRSTILFHTNSWELSGAGPHDITSYFFSFFWSPST